MGRARHQGRQRKTEGTHKSLGKASQQPEAALSRVATEPGQLSSRERILALQQLVGNRSVSRMMDGGGAKAPGRAGRMDFAAMVQREGAAAAEPAAEGAETAVHNVDAKTYAAKGELARNLAQGLSRVMNADYEAMIQDEKGLKAIDTTAKVDRYLEAAFDPENRMYHDYIGKENLPLVLEQIDLVAGLYEKLGLLLAMEPHHGKLIGTYLDIPPLKGFHYKITTTAGSGSDFVKTKGSKIMPVDMQALRVDLVCDQEGEELWTQSYFMGAVGVSAGYDLDIPLGIAYAEGEFDTLVYWGPGDFPGRVDMGEAKAAIPAVGYAFSVGTFHGNGSKGSLTVDLSGKVYGSVGAGVSVAFGEMWMVGKGTRSGGPRTVNMENVPKIRVTEEIDREMAISFPEESAEGVGKSFKRDFLKELDVALRAERLHVTITGKSTYDKRYNLKLMRQRIKATRAIIEEVVKDKNIEPDRVAIEEVEKVPSGGPEKGKDPPGDRATWVKMKGTITVREE